MALLGVGLALFLSRRHERIVAVRNPWLTVLIALNTLLCMEVPYRELYGEESFSCVLQSLLPNVLFALLPSGLIVRFFGLYTNHLRQRAVLEVTGLTVTDADLGIVGMLPTEEVGDDEEGDRTLIPVRGVSDTSGGGVDSISTYERRQRATLTLGDAGAPPASQLLSAASTPRLGAPSDTASPLADAPAAAAAPRSPGGTGAEREVSHGPVAHTGSTAFESPRSDKWHRVAKVAPQQHPPDVRVGSADPGTGGKVSPAGPSQRKANCASAAVNAFYNSLDASLIYLRLHSAKSQAIALAILCVPRIAYYVARLVVTPAYRTVLAVGCRLDAVDMASFLAITVPFFVLTLPLLPRLVAQSDAFGIRYELGVQLLTFVPFVVWYFYGACARTSGFLLLDSHPICRLGRRQVHGFGHHEPEWRLLRGWNHAHFRLVVALGASSDVIQLLRHAHLLANAKGVALRRREAADEQPVCRDPREHGWEACR